MISVSQQIIKAAITALTGATDAGANVFQSRAEAVQRGESPAIVVKNHTEDTERRSKGVDDNHLDLSVEIYVRGDPWDALADPVYCQAHKIITSDPGIAAVLTDIRKKSRTWDEAEGDMTAGVLVCIFEGRYLSSTTDPTVQV